MLTSQRSLTMPNGLFGAAVTRMSWLCFGGVLAAGLLAALTGGQAAELPKFFLIFQDAPVLLLLGIVLLATLRWPAPGKAPAGTPWLARLEGWTPVWIVAAIAACLIYAGAYLVYRHFALSVDEFMADFDALIIASGHLMATVAPEWRDYVPALQPIFRLEVPGNGAWVSSYLPVNAALRAVFLVLGDPALTGAVLAGVALLALYGVARQLWPERRDAALVAVLLLACSSQFLIAAMTPYAMTAHLALNLIWLWLFLRNTRSSHALAVGVGFAACGLHQVIFHPLFVAPFLLTVLRSRRWTLAVFYAASYAAIGLFWILYWKLLLQDSGDAGAQTADFGLLYLLHRIGDMAQLNPLTSLPLMGLNIFRFIAWQAPLTIPLAFVGFAAYRRQSTVVRDLALGIFLTLAVMVVLMPYQGHGWGYRYLHGLLGSLSLLAAQGWIYLSERGALKQQAAMLAASLLVSVLVIFPWYALRVRTFVTPYAAAVSAIQRSDAQIVLVDPVDIWFGMDLVRNDPFLRTSPKIMTLLNLSDEGLLKLCRTFDVAVFDKRNAAEYGLPAEQTAATSPAAFRRLAELRALMASQACGRALSGAR